MTIESFCAHVSRGVARGIIQAVVEGIEETTNRPEEPYINYDHALRQREDALKKAADLDERAKRVTAPDIEPSPESIDLMGAIKKAAREQDVDLSDIALVEHVLQEQRLARLIPEPPEGTRRVTAPDV